MENEVNIRHYFQWRRGSLATALEVTRDRAERLQKEAEAAQHEARMAALLYEANHGLCFDWQQPTHHTDPKQAENRWSFQRDGWPCWAEELISHENAAEIGRALSHGSEFRDTVPVAPLAKLEQRTCSRCHMPEYHVTNVCDAGLGPPYGSSWYHRTFWLCLTCNAIRYAQTPHIQPYVKV